MSDQRIFPALRYNDARAAIDWLERAFGFSRKAIYEGPEDTIAHAEIMFEGNVIMIGSATSIGDEDYSEVAPAPGNSALYLAAPKPDVMFDRASQVGAQVIREPQDTEYGSREFTVRDPEGNLWTFGTYTPTTH